MKFLSYFFLGVLFVNCENSENFFELNGKIIGDYKGYIYLNYNNIIDSNLVVNNSFYFRGKIPKNEAISSYFSTGRVSAMDKDFYLENKKIKITITIENKVIRNTHLDWITVNSITGTKTSLIEYDYEAFKHENQNKSNWQNKNYDKISQIISKNPKNQYSGDLLIGAIHDSVIDINRLRLMYHNLDTIFQNKHTISTLKRKLFPTSHVGKIIPEFNLPNQHDKLINTKEYIGATLIIDFWASWCEPCRKQIPKITEIYKEFGGENLKILSVSLDKDRNRWLKTIKADNIVWDNVIDTTAFNGSMAKFFDISEIPRILLISSDGKIIADNPSIDDLKKIIFKTINNE